MTSISREEVYSALRTVLDPELNVNIVDLGLVYDVKVSATQKPINIHVLMTLTSPGCPLGTAIIMMIRDSLAKYPFINPEKDVKVEIVFDPPWTQEMMSPEAKAELGF